MYSRLVCGTLEICNSNHKKENDFGLKLYKIDLSKFQELVSSSVNILSDQERSRANRYHFVKDKNRFIICRALLKYLLAEYIGLDISKIQLGIDSNKKPFLSSHPSVFFNLTHSRDYAIITIANSPIGIDIEFINKQFNYKEILTTVFNKLEIDEVLNSKDSHHTFFKFWTRKESIVKAIGKGIDDDLLKIPVTDGSHSLASSLVCNFTAINVFNFNVDDVYIGALAITEDINDFDKIIFSPLPSSNDLKSLTHLQ